MKTKHHHSLLTLILAGLLIILGAATPAQAELRRYILEYTNISNTRAQARGFIVIDDDPAVFNNSAAGNGYPGAAFVKDFQITISKATDKTRNGTFSASDFIEIFLNFAGAVDLSQDLVGQANFFNFRFYRTNPLAPQGVDRKIIRADDGSLSDPGDEFALSSFRPMTTTSARVYKCTLSAKGSYNYCDHDYPAPSEAQWVCKKYRIRANYYITIDPVAGRIGFFWLDPKTRTFDSFHNYALPDLKYAQCRPPTAKAPAGRWEACLPLWCHTEDINIDDLANPKRIDARRCRITCLTGVESLRTFTFNDITTDDRVRLKDHAVARFKGGFFQTTCYDTLHYSFDDPKRDKVLRWPTAFNNPGLTRPGGGASCFTGTMSCRLDTRLTAAALRMEVANGPGNFSDLIAVNQDLLARGWTRQGIAGQDGASLTLQPSRDENLEPLIP